MRLPVFFLTLCFVLAFSQPVQAGLFDSFFASEADEPVVSLGTNVWPGYEPLYLARSLGNIDSNKVNLVEYSSATQVIKAFRSKSIQVAALTLDEVLLLKELGLKPRVMFIMDISHGGDVIVANPKFPSIKALRGQRVGVEASALGAYVLSRALQMNDMALGDIKLVSLEVDEIERAYQENTIDAAVTFEPVRSKLLKKGAVEVFDSSQIPGEIVDVLVASQQAFEESPTNLQHIVDAWFKTLNYMNTNQEEAAKIISKRLRITPKEVIDSYEGLKLPNREENITLVSGDAPKAVANAKKLMDTMIGNGILKKPLKLDNLFESKLVTK